MSNFENLKAEHSDPNAPYVILCRDGKPEATIDANCIIVAEVARRWNLHERLVKALEEQNERWGLYGDESQALLREVKGGE